MPAPIREICLLIVSVEVHVALPAGTTTVSPDDAAVTAALTFARLALAAFMVAASTDKSGKAHRPLLNMTLNKIGDIIANLDLAHH